MRRTLSRLITNAAWDKTSEALKKIQPVTYSKLSNGFRVACQHLSKLEFVTLGVWIDAGSRFETRENNGVAHFLEHLNFKGTKNHSRSEMESVFEFLGAHFNAYTSRDRTAYYIKVFNKDVDRVMNLLADLLKNGEYNPRDIEMERPTILAEMREVEELVDEVIMDNLHTCAYDASTSGLPLTILGPTENISRNINRNMVVDFVKTHYTGPRMSLVCSGGLSHSEVEAIAQKYFGDLPSENHRPQLQTKYIGGDSIMWNDAMSTAHVAWALPICGASHADSVPLQLIQSIFGQYKRDFNDLFAPQFFSSPDKSGTKFPDLEIVQPFYTPYEETGLLGYYFVCSPPPDDAGTVSKMLEQSLSEVTRLCTQPISIDKLEAAKAHFKATQLIANDSTTNFAEDTGRQMIHFGRKIPFQEIFEKVDAVTPESLQKTLHKYFFNVRPVVSCIGPARALPTYNSLSSMKLKAGVTPNH